MSYDTFESLSAPPKKEEILPPILLLPVEMAVAEKECAKNNFHAARLALGEVNRLIATYGLTPPDNLSVLRKKVAEGRMSEIETEITEMYRAQNEAGVTLLHEEAVAIAKEEGMKVTLKIRRIFFKMEQGIIEPVFQIEEKVNKLIKI